MNTVSIKIEEFRDVTLCTLTDVYNSFEGTFCFYLQDSN